MLSLNVSICDFIHANSFFSMILNQDSFIECPWIGVLPGLTSRTCFSSVFYLPNNGSIFIIILLCFIIRYLGYLLYFHYQTELNRNKMLDFKDDLIGYHKSYVFSKYEGLFVGKSFYRFLSHLKFLFYTNKLSIALVYFFETLLDLSFSY